MPVLIAFILCCGRVYADKNQDLGIQVYQDLSSDVLAASSAVNDKIGDLIELNRKSVTDVEFPRKMKDAIDDRLHMLLTSYSNALQLALATNKKIADKKQIEFCAVELMKFRDQVLTPLKAEVEAYEKLNVDGDHKTEAIYGLANDLSIQCSMSTSDLLMETLNHCLVILSSK
jgi:archaellum biogenesis ATPase FlaH